jgi:hypothetical protein
LIKTITASLLPLSLALPLPLDFHLHGQVATDAIDVTLEDARNALEMTIAATSLEKGDYFLAHFTK